MARAVNLAARNSIGVLEQRTIHKVWFLEGATAAAAHRKLTLVMGTNVLSETQVDLWFSRFRAGNWNTSETRGRPMSSEEVSQAHVEAI